MRFADELDCAIVSALEWFSADMPGLNLSVVAPFYALIVAILSEFWLR